MPNNSYTNKREVRNKIINIFMSINLFIFKLELMVINYFFNAISFSLNMVGIKYDTQRYYSNKIVKSVSNGANFIDKKIIIPIIKGIFWLPDKIFSFVNINNFSYQLLVKSLTIIILSFMLADWLFENLVCSIVSFSANLLLTQRNNGEQEMSNFNIEKYKTKDSERYKIYQKQIKKYPNADITQKLAVFSMSCDDKENFLYAYYPYKEELYEFKVKVLEKEPSDDEIVKKLRNIFDKKLEYLYKVLDSHYTSHIFLAVRDRRRLMKRCAIRLFDHMLGFIYDEIKRAELITELNEDDSEKLSKHQKNLRFIGEKMKTKIETYLSNQKEFWKKYSDPEIVEKGDYYYKYDQPNFFNLYKHTNFKLEEEKIAQLYVRDVIIAYDRNPSKKFHLENEDIAEDDMKEFMKELKEGSSGCETMYLESASLLQVCLGHWPNAYARRSEFASYDPAFEPKDERFKDFREPEIESDRAWDGFLPVTDTEIMAPILISGLIHFAEDHLRARYIERQEAKKRKKIEASKSMFDSIGYIGNLLGIGYKQEKKENNALEVVHNNVASSSQANDAVINDSVIAIPSNSTEEQPNNSYFPEVLIDAHKKTKDLLDNNKSFVSGACVALGATVAGYILGPQAAIVSGFMGGVFLVQNRSLTNQDPENIHLTTSQPDDEPEYLSINHTQNEQQDRLEQSRNNQDSRENNI